MKMSFAEFIKEYNPDDTIINELLKYGDVVVIDTLETVEDISDEDCCCVIYTTCALPTWEDESTLTVKVWAEGYISAFDITGEGEDYDDAWDDCLRQLR